MFEKAARMKLRFSTPKGNLSVEDLWDLPLAGKDGTANLDDLAKEFYKKHRDGEELSFVKTVKKAETTTKLQLDIVLRIIEVRLEEEERRKQAVVNKEKKDRILSIMAEKENASLKEASMDELRRMLADL